MSKTPPAGHILGHVPHAKSLGLHLQAANKEGATGYVPYAVHLAGNPETGVLHGGVVTALLDNICGIAVAAALGTFRSIATLDLRIDYMRAAVPGETLYAHAECFKITRAIAFVRGTAYHDDKADPVATCVASFMIDANDKGVVAPPPMGR